MVIYLTLTSMSTWRIYYFACRQEFANHLVAEQDQLSKFVVQIF